MTKSLQLTDQSLRVRLAGSSPVEVILAELLIGHLPLQHVVADHQDRVSHCNGGFLGTTSASEAGVVGPEVGPLGACRGASRLGQRAPEPLRALTDLARATFARRLLVAGAHPTSTSAQKPFLRHQARGWQQKRALSRHPGAPSPDVGPPLCAPRFLSLAVAGEVPSSSLISFGATKLGRTSPCSTSW